LLLFVGVISFFVYIVMIFVLFHSRTFWDIVKKKDVQEYSGIPYVCTLLNCMLWVVYGMPDVQLQVLVVTINAAGCMIETGYLTTYLIFAPKRLRVHI
jgi:solute carrier family 50 protein (sugar transporter)